MPNSFHQLTHDIQARIRDLAYIMWESAGRQQGMALDYWLAAEKEVLSAFQAAAEAVLPAGTPPPAPASDASVMPPPTAAVVEAEAPADASSVPTAADDTGAFEPVPPAQPAARAPRATAAKTATRRTSGRSKASS